jgi:heme-degrading monooxygenase HmoA
MSVVKINAIEVPPGAGPELEKRFKRDCTIFPCLSSQRGTPPLR